VPATDDPSRSASVRRALGISPQQGFLCSPKHRQCFQTAGAVKN
jgi:hypothetical protein